MSTAHEATKTVDEKSPGVEPLLQVKNLKLFYPIKKGIFSHTVGQVKAVNDVSFDVWPKETLGVVGESGCGKSSTGRSIIRLEDPTSGSVVFDGTDITTMPQGSLRPLRRDLQMVFQDPFSSLNPQKRIGDLLAEPLIVNGIAHGAAAREEVKRILNVVGLNETFSYRYPHELSGGQRQRIGVARALMTRPKLIVLDEPVSALDVSIQAQVLNLLKDLQKEFDLTYVFITHGLGAVKYISTRILVMYLGKVMEEATTEQIFDNPRHPYTEVLLSAYPTPDPHGRDTRKRIVVQGDVPSPAKPPTGCVFHTRCPFAKAICSQEEPPLVGTAEHKYACHFPLPLKTAAASEVNA